jgi:hypothetical protein
MPDISQKKRVPKMPIRIHPTQRRALERIAKQRGTTASALIREQVGVLTGVPDPLPRKGRRGANGSYRPGQPRNATST